MVITNHVSSIPGGRVTTRAQARRARARRSKPSPNRPVTRSQTRASREQRARHAQSPAPRRTLWNPATKRFVVDNRQNRRRIDTQIERRSKDMRFARAAERIQAFRRAQQKKRREIPNRELRLAQLSRRRAIRLIRDYRARRARDMEEVRASVIAAYLPESEEFQIGRMTLQEGPAYDFNNLSQPIFDDGTLGPPGQLQAVQRLFDSAAHVGPQSYRSDIAWQQFRALITEILARWCAENITVNFARIRRFTEYYFTLANGDEQRRDTSSAFIMRTDIVVDPHDPEYSFWKQVIDLTNFWQSPENDFTHDNVASINPGGTALSYIRLYGNGGGSKCRSKADVPQYIRDKKTLVPVINPNDDLCAQRCLVLGLINDKKKRENFTRPARVDGKWLKLSKQLATEIGCPGMMSYEDFKKFTETYKEYRVWIFDSFNNACFDCGSEDAKHEINIFHDVKNRHYHFITDAQRLAKNRTLCLDCGEFYYAAKKDHVCKGVAHCRHCNQTWKGKVDTSIEDEAEKKVIANPDGVIQINQWKHGIHDANRKDPDCCGVDSKHFLIDGHYRKSPKHHNEWRCLSCNHHAYSEECRLLHEKLCETTDTWYCQCCKRWLPREGRPLKECLREHQFQGKKTFSGPHGDFEKTVTCCHNEGKTKCDNCGEMVDPATHKCFMQRVDAPNYDVDEQLSDIFDPIKKKTKQNYIAFDFECFIGDRKTHSHRAEAHRVSAVAWENLRTGDHDYIEGDDAVSEFARFCKKQKNTTFIAHNGRGYDFVILSRELHRQFGLYPKKVCNGSKIMIMKVASIKFIDSLSHVASRLSAMPKTFDLPVSVRKGYYPYAFDTPDNQDYIGPIPDQRHFIPDSMSTVERQEFELWHTQMRIKNEPWNLRQERRLYCENDVHILAESMKVYMRTGVEETGINPLTVTTIASYVMRVFRTNHLADKVIGVLSKDQREFAQRALYGGRTDITNPIFELTDEMREQGWEIRYDDIVSLYPSVMWDKPLPIGHPTIKQAHDFKCLTSAELTSILMESFGFADVTVQPPNDLIHPVLPGKDSDGKLNFTLHRQRGAWTIVEIQEAIRQGYQIEQIHELHEYKSSSDVFKDIIRKFFKVKQESSWGGGSPQQLDAFIREAEDQYGIKLDRTKCKKNPGRRQLAKLILNSLWGKFAQRPTLIKDVILKKGSDWHKMIEKHDSKKILIKNELLLNPDTDRHALHVQYVDLEAKNDGSYNTNHALASHVTAHARLRLYDEMKIVGSNLLGHDTDSLWYAVPPGGYTIPQGDQLGMWEPEDITANGFKITGVIGTGPKSYAMRIIHEESEQDFTRAKQQTEAKLQEKIHNLCRSFRAPNASASQLQTFVDTALTLKVTSPNGTLQSFVRKNNENERNLTEMVQRTIAGDEAHCELQIVSKRVAKEYVKAKGITLNSQNAQKIHYSSMRKVATSKSVIRATGTALKRRRDNISGEFDVVSLPDSERSKIFQFTASKRVPSKNPDHPPGFTVPRGYRQ